MTISFSDRVKVPDGVLISNLQEESVILNLDNERYYGLDNVGTRMLTVLSTSNSVGAAYELLLEEYAVEGEVLRRDLLALVEQLVAQGLVSLESS
ncbi:MAG TPA: PqqD family protein [Pyrinomonadaceae bacterium]|nr:PqqD family protein [Pyrinomonadaceae bacterium]